MDGTPAGFPDTGAPSLGFELDAHVPPLGDAEDLLFGRISQMSFGPDEKTIYLVDAMDRSIYGIDLDRVGVHQFGGEGDGPGEFRRPLIIQVLTDRIDVFDGQHQRTTSLSPSGTVIGTHPAPELHRSGQMRPFQTVYRVRYGQVVASLSEVPGTRDVWFLDERGEVPAKVHSFPTGSSSAHPRSQPDVLLGSLGLFRPGGGYGVIGDSIFVAADTYHGVIEWYRIEEGRLALLGKRDQGWDPIPLELTEDEARLVAADRFDRPEGDIEVRLPPFRGRGYQTLLGAPSGDVWLNAPGWSEPRRPDSFRLHALVVPRDSSRPARNALLPENFLLRAVSDSAVLGVHVDPVSHESSVRVYRILWDQDR
jgi:hypothetical protein